MQGWQQRENGRIWRREREDEKGRGRRKAKDSRINGVRRKLVEFINERG